MAIGHLLLSLTLAAASIAAGESPVVLDAELIQLVAYRPHRPTLLRAHDHDTAAGECTGSVGDCDREDSGGAMMETERWRRELARRRIYISYGALKRDRIPCSRRGRSYYNCGRSRRANPYRRGCSEITHCARHTND